VPKAPKEKTSRVRVEAGAARAGPDNSIPANLILEVLQVDASRCKDPNRGKVSPEALALLRSASSYMLRGVAMEAASKSSTSDTMQVALSSIKRVCSRDEFAFLGDALENLTASVTEHIYDVRADPAQADPEERPAESDPTPAKVDAPRKRAAAEPRPAKAKRKAAPAVSESQQKLTFFVKREPANRE
jgi:hypothetical protein